MSIETELKSHIKQNDYAINVIEADDLIAAWCFQRNNKFKRSYDFSKVPTEYRYSAPPSEKDTCMACHVSFNSAGVADAINPSQIKQYGSTAACHHSHVPDIRRITSINELQAVDFAKRNISPYISPVMDSVTLARVTKDLGITGKVSTKIIKGRQYIVFGRYAAKRTLFRGTIYSARNAKIVQMAIGSLGIQQMVKSGARITVYATVPLTILECILKDQFTMANIVGRVTSDLIKVGIGSIVGGLFGIGAGAVSASVVLPICVTILFCIGTGYAVEKIDQHYGLTNKLVKVIEQSSRTISEKRDEIEMTLGRKLYEAEREFIYRTCGFDIGRLKGR